MNEPKVSIIVPVFNGEKYIQKCIECLISQSYKNIEILFVDDGSKDRSGDICDELADRFYNVKVVHQENQGLAGARNTGILNASGKYVLFVDVDDAIISSTVEENVRLAEENEADVVLFNFWYNKIEKKLKYPNEYRGNFIGNKADYFDKMLCTNIDYEIFNAPWNKMIKREVLIEEKIFFDPAFSIYEDIIFAPKIMSAAEKIVVNEENYYIYNIQSTGTLLSSFHMDTFDALNEFYVQAMKYCQLFTRNSAQRKKMADVFVRHTFTYIKQISRTKKIGYSDKLILLKKICQSKLLKEELLKRKFHGKKEWMKKFICSEKAGVIIFLYNLF